MRTTTALPVLLLSLGLTGCWFGKKKTPKVPVNLPVPTGAPKSTLPPLPQDPFPPPNPPPTKAPPVQSTEGDRPADTPPAHRRRPSSQKPSPASKPVETPSAPAEVPAPAPSAPSAPQSPPPRLGEVLDEDTRRQYETELTNYLASAEAAVQKTAGRQLTSAQKETVQRIQSFIAQARQAKDRDLSTALQLARRADLLGQDLSASLP